MAEKGCLKDGIFNNLEVAGLLAFNGTKVEFDDNLTLSSNTTEKPVLTLENTNDDTTGSMLKFLKNTADSAAAGDVIGNIDFVGEDADENSTDYATILAKSSAVTSGSESGSLHFNVATTTSGALGEVMVLEGGATAATSTVTIGGNLTVNGRIIQTMTETDIDAQNGTISAAIVNNGFLIHTSVTGAGTLTTDTAENYISNCGLSSDNQCISFYIINDGDQEVTIAGGTGVTIKDAGQKIAENESAHLIIRRTASDACVVYIIGS